MEFKVCSECNTSLGYNATETLCSKCKLINMENSNFVSYDVLEFASKKLNMKIKKRMPPRKIYNILGKVDKESLLFRSIIKEIDVNGDTENLTSDQVREVASCLSDEKRHYYNSIADKIDSGELKPETNQNWNISKNGSFSSFSFPNIYVCKSKKFGNWFVSKRTIKKTNMKSKFKIIQGSFQTSDDAIYYVEKIFRK